MPYGTKITYKDGYKILLPFYIRGEYKREREMTTSILLQPDINSASTAYKKQKEVTLVQNAYSYELNEYKDNIESNVVSILNKKHWIASKCESLKTYVNYCMFWLQNGNINCSKLYTAGHPEVVDVDYEITDDYEEGTSLSLRPVVELEANIFGTKVENAWKLNK